MIKMRSKIYACGSCPHGLMGTYTSKYLWVAGAKNINRSHFSHCEYHE